VVIKNCQANDNNASFISLQNSDPESLPFLKVRANGFQAFRCQSVTVTGCEGSGNIVSVNGADPLAPSSANGFIFNGSQLTLKGNTFTNNLTEATENSIGAFGINISLYNTDNDTYGEIRNPTAPLLNNVILKNVISGNGRIGTLSSGIYVQSNQDGEIKDNNLNGNLGNGIYLDDGIVINPNPVVYISNNILVTSNNLNTNSQVGISDGSSGPNIFLNNNALKNTPNYLNLAASPIVSWSPPDPYPLVTPGDNLDIQ
jgi:hypothetical protein